MRWERANTANKLIELVEQGLLIVIGLMTLLGVFQELAKIYQSGVVKLADLLLLFIYTEVIGMIGVFYRTKRIPIILPIFIGITGISRLIILQGKEMAPVTLLYESGSILILALACLVVRHVARSGDGRKTRPIAARPCGSMA